MFGLVYSDLDKCACDYPSGWDVNLLIEMISGLLRRSPSTRFKIVRNAPSRRVFCRVCGEANHDRSSLWCSPGTWESNNNHEVDSNPSSRRTPIQSTRLCNGRSQPRTLEMCLLGNRQSQCGARLLYMNQAPTSSASTRR